MKYIKLLLLSFLLLVSTKTYAAYQLYADSYGVNIPYGTKLKLTMAQDVTSSNISQGDIFQAYLSSDIFVNDKLVLPAKTIFRGRVSKIKYSSALSRPASLYLTLDHLVTKKGTQLPINAGIASNFEYVLKLDGTITTNGNYFKAVAKDTKLAGKIVPRTIAWGRTSGDNLFKGARYVFVPVAAIGGGIACAGSTVYNAFADLIRHGDEIYIKQGTPFEILILQTLEIPS